MNPEIIIKLDENQRFLIEDPDSVRIVMVDEIIIHPLINQIVYSGYAFDVDYEKVSIGQRYKIKMLYNVEFDSAFSEDD